jgi:hypothetical protein
MSTAHRLDSIPRPAARLVRAAFPEGGCGALRRSRPNRAEQTQRSTRAAASALFLLLLLGLPAAAVAQPAPEGEWLAGPSGDALELVLTLSDGRGSADHFEWMPPPPPETEEGSPPPVPPEPPRLAVPSQFDVVAQEVGWLLRGDVDGQRVEIRFELLGDGVAQLSREGVEPVYRARRIEPVARELLGDWEVTAVADDELTPTRLSIYENGVVIIAPDGDRSGQLVGLGPIDSAVWELALERPDGLYGHYRAQPLADGSVALWPEGRASVWILYRGERPAWHPPVESE